MAVPTFFGIGIGSFSLLALYFFIAYKRQLKCEKTNNPGIEPQLNTEETITPSYKTETTTNKLRHIIKDFTKTIMPSRRDPLLEFIVLGKGKNLHQTVPYDKNAEYVSERTGQKYKIDEENLVLFKPFWGRNKLVAIFHKDGTPVKIEASKKKEITAETLYLADRSTALGQSIKEMFTTHLNIKKILFFVIIGVVGVVVVLILIGGF